MDDHVEPQAGLRELEPYVPGTPIEDVQRAYGLEDVIKLASNENPLGPSPRAVQAMREALPTVHLYPDGQSVELRHALARRLGVEAESVTVGNGADGIIVEICMAYLDGDSEVMVSESSFPVYDIYTRVMRAKLVKTPLQDYRLDLEAMVDSITPRTKVIFVCNPNNPTGTIVTRDEVARFVERVPPRVLVVFDEAYYELVDSDDYPETLAYVREGRGNVIVLRTFSKIFGLAGIRLGYAISVPQVLAPLRRVKEPFSVNRLAQAAGVAALSDDAFVERTVEMTRRGRSYLVEQFERLGLQHIPSHTNFVLVRVGPRAAQIQEELLKRGVIVRPCAQYSLPEFLRVTVGTDEENARLVAAMEDALPAPI